MGRLVRRFGGFSYCALDGLRKDGKPVHLGPQPRRLLEMLLESRGVLVSRNEIAARLWPDRPASSDSIDRCSYLLRKPLRDAGGRDLIATAYGRGISLRVLVEDIDADAPEAMAVPAAPEPDAHILDLWQTAYELSGARTREGFARAHDAVAAALAHYPSEAAAWSLSADIAAGRAIRGFLRPYEAACMIEAAAGRALDLTPGITSARAVLGWARGVLEDRLDDGLALLDQALADEPGHARARAYRPWLLAASGRLNDALTDAEQGLLTSPLDLNLLVLRAWLAFCVGDFRRLAQFLDEAAARRPDSSSLRLVRAALQSMRGEAAAAIESCRAAVAASPDDTFQLCALAHTLAIADKRAEAESIVRSLSHPNEALFTPPCSLAAPMLALGRRAEALALIERARWEGCPWFAFAGVDPRFKPIRAEIERIRATPRAELARARHG